MSKIKFFILVIVFFIVAFNVKAQVPSNELGYPKNIIKTNPFKLGLGSINLSYERVLTDYNSLNLRMKTSFSAPLKNSLEGSSFDGVDWGSEIYDIPKYSTISFDLEYRFYSKKKVGPQGFYAAPYLRYSHFNMVYDGSYSGMLNRTYRDQIDGMLTVNPNVLGAGVQLGAQWLINNRVTIDWSFFGLGVDLLMLKGNIESSDLINDYPQMREDLSEFFSENRAFKNNSINVDGDKFSVKTRLLIPGFKSGFTIGYAF